MSTLLEVADLRVAYWTGSRRESKEVLHGTNIQIRAGETLGLVGESGSGKTTLGRAVLGLVPATSGSIRFEGQEIVDATARRRRELARDIQVVFQDPYTSLNPSMQVSDILSEPLRVQGQSARDSNRRVADLLDRVNLPRDALQKYPREFSGGQRQRIAIARSLALEPKLIVCDEPVSALDLSTQARVLDLFIDLQQQTGVAYLFISHDLAVIRHISHRVAVMYRGDIVETGPAAKVTVNPDNEYTKRLLLAAPLADPVKQRARRQARARLGHRGEDATVGQSARVT